VEQVSEESCRPTLLTSYTDLKKFLLGHEARNARSAGIQPFFKFRNRSDTLSSESTSSGVVPMNIELIETTVLSNMDPKAKKTFISACKGNGLCYGSDHQIVSCPHRIKVDEAYFCSITFQEDASFRFPLQIAGEVWSVLVDTGAQGSLFISARCCQRLKLKVKQGAIGFNLRGFNGTLVEQTRSVTDTVSFLFEGRKYHGQFVVVSQLPVDAIIGLH
jgi:hypothetical protein